MSSKSELEVLKTLYEMLNGLTMAAERASEDNDYPDVERFIEERRPCARSRVAHKGIAIQAGSRNGSAPARSEPGVITKFPRQTAPSRSNAFPNANPKAES